MCVCACIVVDGMMFKGGRYPKKDRMGAKDKGERKSRGKNGKNGKKKTLVKTYVKPRKRRSLERYLPRKPSNLGAEVSKEQFTGGPLVNGSVDGLPIFPRGRSSSRFE